VEALDIRPLQAVVTVARARSLKAAAELLNMSQTTVSRQIQGIETELGEVLFRRGWSGAELTQAGEVVEAEAGRILAALAECETELSGPERRMRPLAPLLRLRDLDAVTATVETGSVSAAALRLGRGQPEISRAVSQLSAALGVKLFERRGGGMRALPAARVLDRLGRVARFHIGRIGPELAAGRAGFVGRVAVGMLPFSGQALIARAFARLTNLHPRIRLVAVPGSYPGLVDALRRREIDLMLGVMRGTAIAADLVEERLHDEEFTVVARADHPLRYTTGPVETLGDTAWVVAPLGTPIRGYFEALFARSGRQPPVQTCEILSFSSAEQMLVESNSVGLLSYSRARLARLRPDLAPLALDLPDAAAPIALTRLAAADPDRAVRIFEEMLRTIIEEEETGA